MNLKTPEPEVDLKVVRKEFAKAKSELSKKDRKEVETKVKKKEKAIGKESNQATWTKDS
jgi:hypothetical protein